MFFSIIMVRWCWSWWDLWVRSLRHWMGFLFNSICNRCLQDLLTENRLNSRYLLSWLSSSVALILSLNVNISLIFPKIHFFFLVFLRFWWFQVFLFIKILFLVLLIGHCLKISWHLLIFRSNFMFKYRLIIPSSFPRCLFALLLSDVSFLCLFAYIL